jgi:hypothetical protein
LAPGGFVTHLLGATLLGRRRRRDERLGRVAVQAHQHDVDAADGQLGERRPVRVSQPVAFVSGGLIFGDLDKVFG